MMDDVDKNRLVLRPGELLFQKGDPGGDLYFIEDGLVEIFVFQDGRSVVYTEMGAGEIVGVMTCLTAEPRMASARAKTDLVCKRVPHRNIEQALTRMPKWFRVVVKEYANRLDEMNRRYAEVDLQKQALEENQVSHRYTAAQLAAAIVELAPLHQQSLEGRVTVDCEQTLQATGRALNQPPKVVDLLFKVFRDSGLLRLENNPKNRREVITDSGLAALVFFTDFVANRRSGKIRALLKMNFKGRELKLLVAMAALAAKQGGDGKSIYRLSLGKARELLSAGPMVKFDLDLLAPAVESRLLTMEGEGPDAALLFVPTVLGNVAASLESWRRLGTLDRAGGPYLGSEDGKKGAKFNDSWYYE